MRPRLPHRLLAVSLPLLLSGVAHAADPGLVAHYPLDGDARTPLKPHAGGVVIGGAATTDRFGRENRALQIGRDCAVHIPTAAFQDVGSADFSVTFWFRASADMSRPGSTLLRSNTQENGRHGLTIWFGDAEATPVPYSVGAEVWSAGKNAYVRNDAPLNDDTWRHVALVRQGAEVRFYIDGALAGTAVSPPLDVPVLFGEKLVLGNGHNPYDDFFRNRFVGAFDDLRIYDRGLGANDIQALVAAPAP